MYEQHKKDKKVYYHLCDHIYISQFRDELILLDTLKDKYIICSQEISDLLIKIIENSPFHHNEIDTLAAYPHIQADIQNLLDNQIIEIKDFSYPYHIDKKVASQGVPNVDWRLPLDNLRISFNLEVLKALYTLTKINFYMKRKGFYNTICLIKKNLNPHQTYITPPDEDLKALAKIMNKACLIYRTRTKCLEWAMTYVMLALKRGWKCNLEIGVQNYPFFAHAWVECNGKIIMDSEDLRDGMAIILNEPFRKLKV